MWCDDNDVDYLFGLSRNARLTERIGRQLCMSRSRCVSTGKARFCDFRYRTRGSWSRVRRVVAKAEWRLYGLNARFVVTSLSRRRLGLAGTGDDRAQVGSGEVPQGCRPHLRAQGSALVFFNLRRNRSPGSPAYLTRANPEAKSGLPTRFFWTTGGPGKQGAVGKQGFS